MNPKDTQDTGTSDSRENEDGKETKDSADESVDAAETKETLTLEDELTEKVEEAVRLREQFLLLQAETENFKKRMTREKNDFVQFSNERLLKEVIPIHENLQRALVATDTSAQSLKEGVGMIFKQFTAFLEKEKVKPISAMGEKFDPAVHEALSQVESDEHEENTVIQEFSKGFLLNDRVLMPAKVVISKKPTKSEPPKESDAQKKDKHESVLEKKGRPEKGRKKHEANASGPDRTTKSA